MTLWTCICCGRREEPGRPGPRWKPYDSYIVQTFDLVPHAKRGAPYDLCDSCKSEWSRSFEDCLRFLIDQLRG